MKYLRYPFCEKDVRSLKAGDPVSISGLVCTGRDMFHKAFADGIDVCAGGWFKDGALYHCGPVVTGGPGGWRVAAAGPTTSVRENPYEARFIAASGVRLVIGKGGMDAKVHEAMAKHGCVYVQAVGGAAALYAACIKRVAGVSFLDEFGAAEASWRFETEGFCGVVAMDTRGGNLFASVEETSRRRLRELGLG